MIPSRHISTEEMARRVSRFQQLRPLPVQASDRAPQAARDVVYARELLSVIGLEGTAKSPSIRRRPSQERPA